MAKEAKGAMGSIETKEAKRTDDAKKTKDRAEAEASEAKEKTG